MNKKAFTLMELLIVVSIIAILAVGVIVLIDPISYINRAIDITRKKDLDDAKKAIEQYYTDTGCYPKPTQICIDGNNTIATCHICTKGQSPRFSYFAKDICDPKQGASQYLYYTQSTFVSHVGNVVATCPQWFKIFSILEGPYNASEDIWGCIKWRACGVLNSGISGYSYQVMGGNPPDAAPVTNWYCYLSQFGNCSQCSPYENCNSPINLCYNHVLYPLRQLCCNAHSISPCN